MSNNLYLSLLGIFLLGGACKPKETAKPITEQLRDKTKAVGPPTSVERHVVDLTDDFFKASVVLDIDAETPVIELICVDKWSQSDYDSLSKMIMLETLRLEKFPKDKINLAFVSKIKTLKHLFLSGSQFSDKDIVLLKDSNIEELDLSGNAAITISSLKALKVMPRLTKLTVKGHPQAAEFSKGLAIKVIE